MVLYIPSLRNFFEVLPLNGGDLSIAAGTGVIVLVLMEFVEWFKRR